VLAQLSAVVGPERVKANVPLAPMTTFGVGGPADWFVEVRSVDELRAVVRATGEAGVPLHVLGGGSNVLVGDTGVRGVVMRMRLMGVSQPAAGRVRADAGLTMNGLVRWTVGRGLAGLESWAGTPGTVGGAIHGNAHYGGHDISEYVATVAVVTPQGAWREEPASAMGFGYDTSRLFETGEVVVWAEFMVSPGDPDTLRAVARRSLTHRKQTQPLQLPSAGCVFQNPLPGSDVVPDGIPWSAGALIDRAGLKGARSGDAQVSIVHANFIVAGPSATAADIRALIVRAKRAVHEQFGVQLREEIVYLGED
jgi:UDP-N-acetylmuramate dehydrogenase